MSRRRDIPTKPKNPDDSIGTSFNDNLPLAAGCNERRVPYIHSGLSGATTRKERTALVGIGAPLSSADRLKATEGWLPSAARKA